MPYYKRSKLNLKVKREFQKWLLLRILGVVVLSSLVAALLLYFYARQEITGSFYEAHIRIRRVSDLLLPVVLAGTFVSLLSGMLLALFLPQRIAGPIYRIETDLKAVQEGDLTFVIHLRRNDILKDFSSSVNFTVATLRDCMSKIKSNHEELRQAVIEDNHEKIKVSLEQQQQQLDYFKVD